jgi:hypothetical protein
VVYGMAAIGRKNAYQPLPSPIKCLQIPVKSEARRRPIIRHSSEKKAGMGQTFPKDMTSVVWSPPRVMAFSLPRPPE